MTIETRKFPRTYRGRRGPSPKHRTWLSLWMSANGLSNLRFAHLMCCSPARVSYWRTAHVGHGGMSRRMAMFARTIFPDIPLGLRGGMAPKLSDPLPVNSRTPKMYRALLVHLDILQTVEKPMDVWPQAIEHARLGSGSKPGQVAPAGGEPNGDGVGDVLKP